jgi:hypothetical protein
MDASFNDYDNYDNTDDEQIRPPDEVIRERLIEDTRCDFQKQMDEALYLSMQEVINQEKINKSYEDEIVNNYLKETTERREKFGKLLMDMNKLIRLDAKIKEIYEIIEPVIFTYCEQHIEIWETDEETYEKIFKNLSTIRTDKTAVELLKRIIINTA